MPSDARLYIEHVQNPDSTGYRQSARGLGLKYDLSPSSVAGRLSRAAKDPETRLAAARSLCLEIPESSPAITRQQAIVDAGIRAFQTRQWELIEGGVWRYSIFASDMHIPYTRWDAVNLLTQIVAYTQPAYVTAYNDMYDMQGYGKWADERTYRARLWSQDLEIPMRAGKELLSGIKAASPHTLLLGIMGNHDLWLFDFLRKRMDGIGEKTIADWMDYFANVGVLHFGRGDRQDVVQLAPNLVYTHGWYASKNTTAVAKNTLHQTRDVMRSRTTPDVVTGHTHRMWMIKDGTATHYSSGALSRLYAPWSRTQSVWNLGIVVHKFRPDEPDSFGALVEFHEMQDKLIARFDGVTFDVPLDRSCPDDNI